MFEAGRSNLFEFSSNSILPVSSEKTLIPTIAEDNPGLASIPEILLWSSVSVLVELELFGAGGTTPGVCGVATGSGSDDGLGTGEGVCCVVVPEV